MGSNIPEYGWFIQYDAGMGERGLKDWAKKISKKAQKKGAMLSSSNRHVMLTCPGFGKGNVCH